MPGDTVEANKKLEQLEDLHSEDTPCHPMITHDIEQFVLNPKSKQDKVKLQI